jgi:hypothetical protein
MGGEPLDNRRIQGKRGPPTSRLLRSSFDPGTGYEL